MGLFGVEENRIKCGRCSTEFDVSKNRDGCPLCGFGDIADSRATRENKSTKINVEQTDSLNVPPELRLECGNVVSNDETKTWGNWLMFNDFFAPKFLTRVLAWKIKNEGSAWISAYDFMDTAVREIQKNNLHRLKGFPNTISNPKNLEKDNAVTRLFYHFLKPAAFMGFFEAKSLNKPDDVWTKSWKDIKLTLTKEGLEFARLRNPVFDEHQTEQVLSTEEQVWLMGYLKQIDSRGHKEYSVLKEVYNFLKSNKPNAGELWNWFRNSSKYRDYVKRRSERARKDPKILQQQMENYAATFMSAKISLLRELGVIRNKRNDYSIMGELR